MTFSAVRVVPWLIFWSGAALLAAGTAVAIEAAPVVAVLAVVLPVAALVCRKWPYAAFTALFVLSGGFWSIQVFTGLPVSVSADLVFGGLWLATLYAFLTADDGGARPRLWPGAVAAMAFIALSLASAFVSDDLVNALCTFRVSYWYMLSAVLVAYAPLPAGALWVLTRVALMTALAVSGYAILRWAIGPAASESAFARSAAVQPYETVDGSLRLIGSMGTGHLLASWMAAMTPFCVALAAGLRGPWRLVASVAAALCAVALMGTSVRAGILAAALGVALVLALAIAGAERRRERVGAALLTAVVAIGGATAIVAIEVADEDGRPSRLAGVLNPGEDASIRGREQKWADVLEDINEHPLGQGLGTSGLAQLRFGRYVTISTMSVDSTYLKIALEQGLAVMACFIMVLLLLLAGLSRAALARSGGLGATVAAGAAGALLAFGVEMTFHVYFEGIAALGIWLVIGIGLRTCSQRETSPA
jgi:O-antigen ligase